MARSFDTDYIYDLYNRPSLSHCSEDFYGSASSELPSMTDQSLSFSKWDIELNPKIKKHEDTHYLCPKCLQFPLIDIISKEIILYQCKCKGEKRKALNIKTLFNNVKEYMTSFKGDKIEGFRCIENHNSKKNRKFRYFCVDCSKNICSECIVNHTDEKGEKHNLIVLDFNKPTNYKQVKQINKIINEEKKKEENNNSNNNSSVIAHKILSTEEEQDKKNNTKTNKIIITYGNEFIKYLVKEILW